jgi:hypothetical protein
MCFNFLPVREDFRENPPQMAQITQMRSQKIETRIIAVSHFFIAFSASSVVEFVLVEAEGSALIRTGLKESWGNDHTALIRPSSQEVTASHDKHTTDLVPRSLLSAPSVRC